MVFHGGTLVFITTAIVATVAEVESSLLFVKLASQRQFKKFDENRPLHGATPGELISPRRYTQVSAKCFNV